MIKNRFIKSVFTIVICSGLTFLYTHQEIEILKTSFNIQRRSSELSLLLDQYRSLVYNLSRLETPMNIEEELSINEIALSKPKQRARQDEWMSAAYKKVDTERAAKESLLASIFDRFAVKAEAKVIK